MSPQAAVQPAKVHVSVKQPTTSDALDRIQQTYDSIARRAFEIFGTKELILEMERGGNAFQFPPRWVSESEVVEQLWA